MATIFILMISCSLMSGCGVSRRGYSVSENLPYVPQGHNRQVGDLYLPESEGPWPVMLVIHGGGWNARDRSDMEKFGRRLSREGIAVYNIDYRLAPGHPHPAQLEDVRAALSHLILLAETHLLDLERVGILGYSAGAHLALLAASRPVDSHPPIRAVVAGGAPVNLSTYPDSPYIIDLIGGPRDEFPEIYREASPLTHIGPDHPPALLYHGRWDLLVEVEQSRMYQQALLTSGVPVTLIERPVFGHLATFAFDRCTHRATLRFLRDHFQENSNE
ncbi:MAG: alpha/beta hydrolase [Kiritimatiellae bacterium]|nr:alpha/beta hydrolase [Kiritimatiellia bacterium]